MPGCQLRSHPHSCSGRHRHQLFAKLNKLYLHEALFPFHNIQFSFAYLTQVHVVNLEQSSCSLFNEHLAFIESTISVLIVDFEFCFLSSVKLFIYILYLYYNNPTIKYSYFLPIHFSQFYFSICFTTSLNMFLSKPIFAF